MYAVHAQYPARSCLCAFADELFLCSWGVGLICARVCGVCVRARANAVGVGADVPCSLHVPSSVCFSANDPNLISVHDSEATRATDTLKDPTVNQKGIGKGKRKKKRDKYFLEAHKNQDKESLKDCVYKVSEKQMGAQDTTGLPGPRTAVFYHQHPLLHRHLQHPYPLAEHGLHHTHTYTHSSHRNRNRHS